MLLSAMLVCYYIVFCLISNGLPLNFQAEKAAFDEAEKKREEEVTCLLLLT